MIEQTPSTEIRPESHRLEGVDLLRGLVMVLMALDHTRDYFQDGSIDPTNLTQTTPALFITRWITHLCAPTFALLAGVGVRLASDRGRDHWAMFRYLVTRGLWLILLEQTVVKLGLFFRPNPSLLLGLVFWSLGGSFVILGVLLALRAPAWFDGLLGLAIVVGHNALDALSPGVGGVLRPAVSFLFRPGVVGLPGGVTLLVGYPVLPWFGVVALGYWLGGTYRMGARSRRLLMTTLGLASIALFVVLRVSRSYGDPSTWQSGGDAITSTLSFLNCTKYPPSLQFLLMTLGPTLLLLAAFDGGIGRVGEPLLTFGRVPLFFYLSQWYVAHGLALAAAWIQGQPTAWLFVESLPVKPPLGCVYGLPAVYAWWGLVVLLLYGPCLWFAAFKRRHRDWTWLGYL
ncbi:DUF1624 domain-containing protein [Paludisphaera rhizosphaerae]|uniref:DUF1624 domain-containing protein n=1 Tax=Paludisphaera rhizosphaerae TaxID=2711216 RepID=UPI0013EE2B8A|nr:heparan-alpha-glucosaminide N-acetyltransferase domain-containing protein [Paludisphaera rhizosphaerae]